MPPSVDPVFIALALAMSGVFKNPLVTTELKVTSLVSPPKAFTTSSKDISSFNPSGAKPFAFAILIISFLYLSTLVFKIALASGLEASDIVIFSSRYVVKPIIAPTGTNVGPNAPIFSLKKPDHHEPCFDFIAR